MIANFKRNNDDVATIGQKLSTVITRVSGEKEAKLVAFLHDLVEKLKRDQAGNDQQMIKSEEANPENMMKMEDMGGHQGIGYSYPEGMGNTLIQPQ